MKKKHITLICSLVFATNFFAQTILPSTLSCNQMLSLAGSPYIVNSTITVSVGCNLTVDPGVEIQMADSTSLIIKGKADFLGIASQPIHIHAKDSLWGHVLVDSNASLPKSMFNYVVIENATHGPNPGGLSTHYQNAAISGYYSALEINNCVFKNNGASLSVYQCKNALIKNCTFDSTDVGERIHEQWSDNVTVDSCIFYFVAGSGDAIDYDASTNGTISNNQIYGGDSDGIDIGQVDSTGCDGITVKNNFIYNMGDKGITNGEWCNNIKIDHNLIVGCIIGIGSKAGSHVIADHNTIYGSRVGLKAYDHLDGWGPGNLTVTNSIVAASDTTWIKDSTATLNVSYSLSDSTLISGTGNIQGVPLFVSPDTSSSGDFCLTSGSPAINSGDPSFTLDPDGSRTDMGAFYYNGTSSISFYNKSSDNISVYPNPTSGKITMNLNTSFGNYSVLIHNSLGETVYTGNSIVQPLDISFLPTGIYNLQVLSNKKVWTKKIIKY